MKPNIAEEILDVTRPTLIKLAESLNSKIKKTSAGRNFTWGDIIQLYQKKFFPKFKKSFVLSIIQNKGGVGKTTSVANLGYAFSKFGKTLVIDLDGQSNLSKFYEINKSTLDITLKDVLDDPTKIHEAIVKIEGHDNLYILPNTSSFDMWKRKAYSKDNIQYSLNKALNLIKKDFDFIFIDFPPALDIAFDIGLYASDYAMIVSEPEPFSDDNIENVLQEINRLKDDDVTGSLNLDVLGIFITQYKNVVIMKDITESTREIYEVFNTVIRDNISIPESQAKRQPIFVYNESCYGSEDYFKLWVEIMGKINNGNQKLRSRRKKK